MGYSHLPSILVLVNQLNIKDYKLLNMYIGKSCKILKREKVKKEEGSEEGSGALSFFSCMLVSREASEHFMMMWQWWWWCGSKGKYLGVFSGGAKKIK